MPFVEQDALRNARAKLDNSAISDRLDELTESPALRQFLEFSLQSLKAAQVALARAALRGTTTIRRRRRRASNLSTLLLRPLPATLTFAMKFEAQ